MSWQVFFRPADDPHAAWIPVKQSVAPPQATRAAAEILAAQLERHLTEHELRVFEVD